MAARSTSGEVLAAPELTAPIRQLHAPFPPRLADEPAAWYKRLCQYCLQYPVRSIAEIYREERLRHGRGEPAGQRGEQVPLTWRQNFTRFRWVERAETWDLAELERLRLVLVAQREQQRQRELSDAAALRKKALALLDLPHVRKSVDGHTIFPANAQFFQGAARMLEASSKLARLALAMDPERPDVLPEDALDSAIEEELARLAGVPVALAASPRAQLAGAQAAERLTTEVSLEPETAHA